MKISQLYELLKIYHRKNKELAGNKNFAVNQERLIYSCPLPPQKRKNIARQHINKPLLKYKEIAFPHILHVGVTTHCNLHCPACPRGTNSLGRKAEHLDYAQYRRAIDQLSDSLLFMLFWDWGEPMLHPQFIEMIEHASARSIRTVISTNGNVMYPRKKLQRLIAAKPSTIIVCVDGADQTSYESYRAGGKLVNTLQTIQQIKQLKTELGQLEPLIEFRSLATKENESQLGGLLEMAETSGADLFSVKTLRPYNYRGQDVDSTLVPDNSSLARYKYSDNKKERQNREDFVSRGELTCGKPLYAPTLNSDGTLAFCSYATQEREYFGNIHKEPITDIWEKGSSRAKKRDFLKNGGSAACRTCYFRSYPKPTILFQVQLAPFPDFIKAEISMSKEDFYNTVVDKTATLENAKGL